LDRDRLGLLSARIYPDSAERRVEVDTLDFRSGEATWALKHPVRLTYGERLQVDDFALTSGKRGLTVDGVVDRRGEQRLVVRIDSLPIGWLGELAGIGAFDGDLSGALDLTGPAEGPNATGNLALDVRSRSKKVGRARLRLDWPGAGGLRLDAGVYHPEGDSLRIAGHVPLALSLLPGDSGGGIVRRIPGGTLSLYATAQHFRIDMARPMLDPATVKSLRGRLTVDAQARGSLESPELSGTLDLSDGKVQITRLGATYDKGRIRAAFHDDGIRLTEAQFASGNGRLDAEGTIRLRKSTPALDLNATLQDFRLADAENFRSTVSGKVHLGGTPAAPALTGSVDVKNLDFYLQASSGSQAEPIELTPADLRVLEDRFGLVADRPRRGEPSSLAMDLQVALAGNDWVRRRTSPAIAVELSGKLRIQKDSGQDFRIFGAIQPLAGRSFAEVLGRRFEVTSGEVGLNGPLKNARLALMAEYQADSGSTDTPSGVVITTRLTVDSGRVAVTLGSRPTMSDADVKSYLATGRPAGTDPTQTGEETNPLTAGASLAVSAALGSVAGGAGRALGLDVIQVLQDRNGAQTLVAGKYVSPPLYLGFRQPIVARDDPSESRTAQTTMEWEVEYAALRRALLNFQGSGNEFRAFLRMRRR
jgi:translocation and assembly module TamB